MNSIKSMLIGAGLLLTAIQATYAANLNYMIITMNGNNGVYISLPLSDTPTLLVYGDLLQIQTGSLNMGSINKNDVKHITYSETAMTQGINEIKMSDITVNPRVTHATITISGLKDGDNVSLYNAAGAACNAAVTRQGGAASVDMTAEPNGLYILTVNKESYKIIKK